MKILKWGSKVPKEFVGKVVVMTKAGIEKWTDQSRRTVGTIVAEKNPDGWAPVHWGRGIDYRYRSGDLQLATKKQIADSAKIEELIKKKKEEEDRKQREEVIDWADKAVHTLEAAVHAKGCKLISQCPRQHDKCSKHLDFKTALYWEMASLIYASSERFKFGKENEQQYKWGMGALRTVLMQHRDDLPQAIFDLLNQSEWYKIKNGYQK